MAGRSDIAGLQLYGRVMPHDKELEKVVLGIALLEQDAAKRLVETLSTEDFYESRHGKVYEAIRSHIDREWSVDIISVSTYLRNLDGDGEWPYFVTRLTNDVVSAAGLDQWMATLKELTVRRTYIGKAGDLMNAAYDTTIPLDQVDGLGDEVASVSHLSASDSITHISYALAETMGTLDELRNRGEHITGVPSGHPLLDRLTCGWQESDLVILAARPSVGKTAFALSLVAGAASHGFPVGMLSLEMSTRQLVNRLLADKAGVFLNKLRDARLSEHDMKDLFYRGVRTLSAMGIFIDDTAGLSLSQLRARCRKMVRRHGCKLIVLDYLQLCEAHEKGLTREQEVSRVSRALKKLAKELRIPIIALSQLSRAIEHRSDPCPVLADLRESGAIEQDADIVSFLYRVAEEGMPEETRLKIAKYRNGELATFRFQFQGEFQRFTEGGMVDLKQEQALREQIKEQSNGYGNVIPNDVPFD